MDGQMRRLIRQRIIDSLAQPVPALTPRDVHVPRVRDKAIAVIGMRRAGKSTFLWQLLGERLGRGTPREGLLYFSFEDERLGGLTAAELHWVVDEYFQLHPEWRDARRATLFLDEIQVVAGWETFARRLLDTERVELFLSGSSARLLSREVATSMRGRAMEALVLPFSFREFLRHRGREPARADRLAKAERSAVEKSLREYLAVGGFPEAQNVEGRDRLELLRGYVDAVLLRDVVERRGVTHPVALRWMVRQLLGNAAGSFSVNKLYGDLKSQGVPVGKNTLHEYLAWLEDAFLIRTTPVATESERRRMTNPRKVYPIDPGLIPVFDRSGRANTGHALETVVRIELERRGAEIAYVRTAAGREVDFLARFPDGRQELIQVSADMDSTDTLERELAGLASAAAEHPRATQHLVTLDPVAARPARVSVHAASLWLLGE